MAGADREDLEQLERAVRGRLLEVQILKLSAQCRAAQSQFEAYLDVASTAIRPKVCQRSGSWQVYPDAKYPPNVETRFNCPQALYDLDSRCQKRFLQTKWRSCA